MRGEEDGRGGDHGNQYTGGKVPSTGKIAKPSKSATLKAAGLSASKGQQAMAVAMLYPKAKRGRGNKDAGRKSAETAGFSERRLRQARTVLRHAPDDATNGQQA